MPVSLQPGPAAPVCGLYRALLPWVHAHLSAVRPHLEILSNFLTRAPHFHFAQSPANYIASPAYIILFNHPKISLLSFLGGF